MLFIKEDFILYIHAVANEIIILDPGEMSQKFIVLMDKVVVMVLKSFWSSIKGRIKRGLEIFIIN